MNAVKNKTYDISNHASPYFGELLRDEPLTLTKAELALHLSDLHYLFMRKFSDLAASSRVSEAEAQKLLAMLQEIIKVKKLLV